ncbi:alpha/beta fold hydrolase [Streptomyces sp. H27-C3]|nr:alpha/beta fold hydrolase [Streptomyces sp. H27-C3]MDJ0463902.1 alpha/beta fold hydrolase [Streptomyces sp. H27-C3]
MSDHRTWHAVEERLVERGYRVVAPDLRGHGRSSRGEYRPDLLADDLVENLPTGADMAMGHSLGGLALSLAAARLSPARAVYCDPGLRLGGLAPETYTFMRDMVDQATPANVRRANPRWSERDEAAEVAGSPCSTATSCAASRALTGTTCPTPPWCLHSYSWPTRA